MSKMIVSEKRAASISQGLFLICIGVLVYTDWWWPGILLAVWLTMASKQFFTGRYYDAILSTIVLVGLFVFSVINFNWSYLLPTLFIVGGVFLIYREFSNPHNGEDKSEEIKEDVDLDKK